MGIAGVYKELGPGKRISLSKLTAESFQTNQRPLRVAIDAAIWSFQNQAAEGGTNPALRNLFYRLARLLCTPIEPVFVFDGPYKPPFKRNKRTGIGHSASSAENRKAKELISLFGFTYHNAPGEAEAECALLQQNGLVDAVLSEDVDTIMFGCTKTLRKWSPEGKGSSPTHVNLYDVQATRSIGLDREGMVLVALMSGGDYDMEGIPDCGTKISCEAAKAGFGKTLCRLKASDKDGLQKWKETLRHELLTNESKFFRTKHKVLSQNIPETFPDVRVLRYYTHPVVSDLDSLEAIEAEMVAGRQRRVDVTGLREYTRETFDWNYQGGAVKFIRVLSQAMLIHNLQHGENMVHKVSGRRVHFSTDATPELRVSHIPAELVPIDLSAEPQEPVAAAPSRSGLALNSDDDFEPEPNQSDKPASKFDIAKPSLTSILEVVAKQLIPEGVEAWEEGERIKAQAKSSKGSQSATRKKGKMKGSDMPEGALDRFVRTTKNVDAPPSSKKVFASKPKPAPPPVAANHPPRLPRRLKPLPASKPPGTSSSTRASSPSSSSPTRPSTPEAHSSSAKEPILISSSPTVATPTNRGSYRQAIEPFFSAVPESHSPSRHLTRAERALQKPLRTQPPSSKTAAVRTQKQSTIDVFLSSSQTHLSPPLPILPDDKEDSVTPISQIPLPSDSPPSNDPGPSSLRPSKAPLVNVIETPPATANSLYKRGKEPPSRSESPLKPPARKKKLFVPRASDVEYLQELVVDEAERDAIVQASRRTGKVAIRKSDVELIDLTEGL